MMRTEKKLKEVIAYWKDFEIPKMVERDFDISYLKSDKVLTITGPRRAGKTYLCFQMINELEVPRQNILYLNFEDERLHPINGDELTKLLDVYREMYEPEEGRIFLFLDEIHVIPGWERWVRRVTEGEKGVKLVITGSSSELMPTEFSTELRGRAINKTVFPFSFSEFLKAKKVDHGTETALYGRERPLIKKEFNEYVSLGGFPEIVSEDEETLKKEILQGYYSTIFQRDIVERYGINNVQAMKDFYKIRMDSFGSKMTFSQSKNNLKSIGHSVSKSTLKRYLSHANDSFLLFDLPRYTENTKNRMRYPRKVYPVDTGLVNALRFNFSEDWGRALETVVFIQLKREKRELFYYSDRHECDFIVKKENRIISAIQVTESLENNREREIKGLMEAMERFDIDEGLILTQDEDEDIHKEGRKIKVRPLWHWLLTRKNIT